MATKQCSICGKSFNAPPTRRVTCSPECATKHRSRAHIGQRNKWSKASRDALSQKGQTINLTKGTPAAKRSPIAGPFETNQEAKLWWVQHIPSGTKYAVRNLTKWCRDNPELFAPDPWPNACAGLRQVSRSMLGLTKRKVSRWKDWTLLRASIVPPAEDDERAWADLWRHL